MPGLESDHRHDDLEPAAFDLPRGTFHALVGGDPQGPKLLYLHGFPDHPPTAEAFLRELIGRGYRLLAPWMRGYAPSRTAGPFDPLATITDVVDLIDRWSPGRPVYIVGHDWGALHTYLACTQAPSRVARAITLALPHPLTFLRQLRLPGQLRRSWYIALFQFPGAGRLAAARDHALIDRLWRQWSPEFSLGSGARAELHACLAASRLASIEYYRPSTAAFACLRSLRQPITVPVLQLHGANDGCVLPPKSDDTARYAGPHEFEVLPGVGHFLHLEAPASIAERVGAWTA